MGMNISRKMALFIVTLSYIVAIIVGWFVVKATSSFGPLVSVLFGDIAGTVIIFLTSRIFDNSSMYDPYWSVAPLFLFLYWAADIGGFSAISIRGFIVLGIALFWGIRLTVNWAANWRGMDHEDWRYMGFRSQFGDFYWLVSFFGIHLFPTLMVFAVSIPAYFILQHPGNGINAFDIVAVLTALGGIGLELFGDLQLHRHIRSAGANSSVYTGLWKLSRHPNYLGEILFWVGIYFFAVAADPNHYWMGLGVIALLLLFVFYSIPAMEKRQLKRRSDYQKILDTTSSLIPLPKKIDMKPGKPLKQRRKDIIYIIIFSCFVCTSFVFDGLNGVNSSLDPSSENPVERFLFDTYASEADPALIANPPIVRISAGISAFLWGPLYVFFIIGFVNGWNTMRNWGFLYGCALTSSMILYIAEGLFGSHASPEPIRYLLVNGTYFLVPVSMIFRMWKPMPFGEKTGPVPLKTPEGKSIRETVQ